MYDFGDLRPRRLKKFDASDAGTKTLDDPTGYSEGGEKKTTHISLRSLFLNAIWPNVCEPLPCALTHTVQLLNIALKIKFPFAVIIYNIYIYNNL